jgi:hypothetical protein
MRIDALLADLAHVRRGYVNAAMGYRQKGFDIQAAVLETAVRRLDEAVRRHVPDWPGPAGPGPAAERPDYR